VARERGFYATQCLVGHVKDIDHCWTPTEQRLDMALRGVLKGSGCDANDWIVAAQFITELFVRGPGFVHRFANRMERLFAGRYGGIVPDERTNTVMAMLFEAQRLYWPVMAAQWTLLENVSTVPFITSDVEYAGLRHVNGELGYVVPVDERRAIAVTNGDRYLNLVWRDGWKMENIWSVPIGDDAVGNLNATMARTAVRSVFGPTQASVEWLLPHLHAPRGQLGAEFLLRAGSSWLRQHEMELFKVITILSNEPPPGVGYFRLR
jgi:hypothetical protein